ncbi:hypothetical protein BDN71DRAFT_599350 [Pleurotus eryngii]|uniref:Uncharacterized protein n=1 Tax=Pleurotus eryngii TaxID=5323 RepID=A0A9P5ZGQ9_PLEER|nr:hypothetical protein BDN71DRAFT_599350 [Pleurotus eryngii]
MGAEFTALTATSLPSGRAQQITIPTCSSGRASIATVGLNAGALADTSYLHSLEQGSCASSGGTPMLPAEDGRHDSLNHFDEKPVFMHLAERQPAVLRRREQ